MLAERQRMMGKDQSPGQSLRQCSSWILYITFCLGGTFVFCTANAFISYNHVKHDSTGHSPYSSAVIVSSTNPNDMETPEERQRRMELVRQLQRSYYKDEEGISIHDSGVIENLPLWRVQWTELPGYQNVLHCHVPHYTHMFMKIISGPKPWYFGHLYLPGGSENLNNPVYKLGATNSMATTTGVLMRVSDYKQLEDGRLLLLVQAMERLQVVEATQHAPYGIATVQIQPDQELLAETTLAAAATEGRRWEDFEFRTVRIDECLTDSNGVGISPLVNYNAEGLLEPSTKDMTNESFKLQQESLDSVSKLEHDVWVVLDTMIQLLASLNPNPEAVQVPIPTQLLGLLPANHDWPTGFFLDSYTSRLNKDKNALVGTASKSPFCWVDRVAPSHYSPMRRAYRLSFAIWVLLEAIAIDGEGASTTRQEILELSSLSDRLDAAKTRINAINKALGDAAKG